MEEDKKQETPKRPEIVKIPPQRGQIKARIFKGFAQKVKNAASLIGFAKRRGGNGSSASTSTYTSEGHSDSWLWMTRATSSSPLLHFLVHRLSYVHSILFFSLFFSINWPQSIWIGIPSFFVLAKWKKEWRWTRLIEIIVVSRYRLYGDCEFCILDTFAEFPVVLYLIYKYAFINFDFLFYSKVLQDGFIFGARLDASLSFLG